jgi:hypothetical protein
MVLSPPNSFFNLGEMPFRAEGAVSTTPRVMMEILGFVAFPLE